MYIYTTQTHKHIYIQIHICKNIYTYRYTYAYIHTIFIQKRKCLLTLGLKVFKLFAFLIESSKLFDIEGPIQEIVFCPMLVLQKGFLSLEKLFLVSILQCGANSKISLR